MCVFSKKRKFFGKNLKNIYGEPLNNVENIKEIKEVLGRRNYCSEQGVDTGLHQICFNLNDNTKFFGRYGQSNWSPRYLKGKKQ